MSKLIIQIPCYNEEQTLGVTLSALPRKIAGIDRVGCNIAVLLNQILVRELARCNSWRNVIGSDYLDLVPRL